LRAFLAFLKHCRAIAIASYPCALHRQGSLRRSRMRPLPDGEPIRRAEGVAMPTGENSD
jgi:hypothetical protein